MHYVFYCGQCKRDLTSLHEVLRCSVCGKRSTRRYLIPWPPLPPAFAVKAEVRDGKTGKVSFRSEMKPSVSSDGTIATVYREYDRRDPDKSQRRYIERVTKANGVVVKAVDGYLTNQDLHGNAGFLQDPPSRPVPGDPMTLRVGLRQPGT